MIPEEKWKFENKSYQIADTGDYDGHGELTKGNLVLFTKDEISEEEMQPIVDALNELDINFQCQDHVDTYFELAGEKLQNQQLSAEIEALKGKLERLKGLVERSFDHGYVAGFNKRDCKAKLTEFKQTNNI